MKSEALGVLLRNIPVLEIYKYDILEKKFYVVYLQSFKAIQRMFCVDFAKNFYSQRWFALSYQGTRALDVRKRFRLRILFPAEKKPRAE